jgi:hypothetical protein
MEPESSLFKRDCYWNVGHTSVSNLVKIHFNIVLPSTPNSCICSLPFIYSDKQFVAFLASYVCYESIQSHPFFSSSE